MINSSVQRLAVAAAMLALGTGMSFADGEAPKGAEATKLTAWADPRPAAWVTTFPLFAPVKPGDGSLQRLQQAGNMRICADLSIKPLSYVDPASGETVGLEVDMAHYLADLIGIKSIEYVNISFASLIPALQADKCDVVMDTVLIRSDRASADGVKFTAPYMRAYEVLTVKAGSPIKKFEDLSGKKLAVLGGSTDELTAQSLIASSGASVTIVPFTGQAECYLATVNGTVEACLADSQTAKAAMPQFPQLTTLDIQYSYQPKDPEEATKNPYHFGSEALITKAADADLNLALSIALGELVKSGKQKEILEKWEQEWSPAQKEFIRPAS